jgi:hypothetical protein
MPKIMVLFKREELEHFPFDPPPGVEGGVVGSTDRGELAVYIVPSESAVEFTEALDASPAVIERKELSPS